MSMGYRLISQEEGWYSFSDRFALYLSSRSRALRFRKLRSAVYDTTAKPRFLLFCLSKVCGYSVQCFLISFFSKVDLVSREFKQFSLEIGKP